LIQFQYLFLLRGLFDARGRNLFAALAADLALDCGQYDLILGKVAPDGGRAPGLIDRLRSPGVEVQQVRNHMK